MGLMVRQAFLIETMPLYSSSLGFTEPKMLRYGPSLVRADLCHSLTTRCSGCDTWAGKVMVLTWWQVVSSSSSH